MSRPAAFERCAVFLGRDDADNALSTLGSKGHCAVGRPVDVSRGRSLAPFSFDAFKCDLMFCRKKISVGMPLMALVVSNVYK